MRSTRLVIALWPYGLMALWIDKNSGAERPGEQARVADDQRQDVRISQAHIVGGPSLALIWQTKHTIVCRARIQCSTIHGKDFDKGLSQACIDWRPTLPLIGRAKDAAAARPRIQVRP